MAWATPHPILCGTWWASGCLFFTLTFTKSQPAAAGTIMLIARFWDMGIDPVIGIISDRTQTRWGKFRPYILFGALPYAILAILTFTTPDFGVTGKIIYAGATYVLLMTAYAAVNLPYSSLAAVMTSDTYERAGLNTYRFICAFGGQFVVTGLALTLVKYFRRWRQSARVSTHCDLVWLPEPGFLFHNLQNHQRKGAAVKITGRLDRRGSQGICSRTGLGSSWPLWASFPS